MMCINKNLKTVCAKFRSKVGRMFLAYLVYLIVHHLK